MDVPINIVAGTLPPGAVYNPQSYFNAIVARMSASISGGNIVYGQLGGVEPNGPLPPGGAQPGLWFGNPTAGEHGYWNDWNTDASKYLPIPLVCGQYVNGALRRTNFICGASSGDTDITTPDESGTLALTSDIVQALGTQSILGNGGSITIDWNTNKSVWITLTANTTFTTSNKHDGQYLDVYVENTGAFNITWAAAHWPNTPGPPTTSPDVVGARVIDHYRFFYQGRILFGQVIGQDIRVDSGVDTSTPTVVSVTCKSGDNNVIITFSTNLQGLVQNGAAATADFHVIKNGVSAVPTGAVANGLTVDVSLDRTLKIGDTATIQYLGSPDYKGLNGNPVANFAARAIVISGGDGGGIHNDPHARGTGPTGIPKAEP